MAKGKNKDYYKSKNKAQTGQCRVFQKVVWLKITKLILKLTSGGKPIKLA